ncbi:MAG TPA: lysophospholipid acyltransferase family protein [Terracidiphilus sp.]|nr:lysophospholipid acyltransferase family protein [Terracidiphilus sp.]
MKAKPHPLAIAVALLARAISGVEVRWAGCRPDARQRIYFANHASHLDFAVLWSALPPELRSRTRPVAAEDYWDRGLRAYFAQTVFHAVLVRRRAQEEQADEEALAESRKQIECLATAMGHADSLILFPEGTRGTGETIAPFRSGLYYLARRKPEVELVPAYLRDLSRILPKGEVLPVPLMSCVTFGEPLHFDGCETKAAFLDRARAAVQALSCRGPQ